MQTTTITGTLCSQDFLKIYEAIDRGSFQSVDEFAHEMLAKGLEDEGEDDYGAIKDVSIPIMPFGKAVTRNRGWLNRKNFR